MKKIFNVVVVEDQPADAELIQLQLNKSDLNIQSRVIQSLPELDTLLRDEWCDLVISDYNIGKFNGKDVLHHVREYSKELPYILVSGYLGEKKAIGLMAEGAQDFVLKDNLERLKPAVKRELLNYDEYKRQQKILKNAYQLAEIGHWHVNVETNEVFWSDGVKRLHEVPLDYQPSLDEALTFFEKGFHRDHITSAVNKAIEEGKEYKIDAKIITAKGNERWVRTIGKPETINDQVGLLYGSIQNITASVEANERIQILSKVASETDNMVLITDASQRIEWANDAFIKSTGYSMDEVEGRNPRFLQGPDTNPTTKQFIRERLKDNKTVNTEILNYTKQGESYWVELNIKPIVDEGGDIERFFSIQKNITDRKNRIANLELEQKRLKKAQEIGRIGDWDFNVKTGEVTWSDMMFEIYERDPSLGAPGYEQTISYYFENKDYYKKIVRSAIEEVKSYSFDIAIKTERGSEKYVYVECIPITDDSGSVKGLNGIVQDITERKESELELAERKRQIQSVTQNVDALLFQYVLMPDGTDKMVYVSDSVDKIFELTPEQVSRSINLIWDQIDESDVQKVLESVQKSADTLTTWDCKFQIETPSGIKKWIHGRGSPERLKDGNTQWYTVCLDITEQVEQGKMNDTLLQEVHHRVKNNLALIIGFLELQLLDFEDNRRERLPLERTMNRIYSISEVHKLLYESSDMINVDVKKYIERLTDHIISSISYDQKCELELEIPELSMNVNELIPFGLILNELVTNSMKYAFKNICNGRIYISIKKRNGSYQTVYKDNGPGIDEEILEKSENPGMVIMKLLLDQLEAEYQFTNEKGFSLTFTFKERLKGAHSNI